jgi:hypothetical protein
MKTMIWIVATVVAVSSLAGSAVQAQDYAYGGQHGTLSNNLFQQYYTQPGASSATAAMYPAPHPVPYKVGHTYYTYQPLMPHEMMWQHRRNYYNFYAGSDAFYQDPCTGQSGGGALNKTTVVWQSGTNHMGPLPASIVPLARLQYRLASRSYGLGGQSYGAGGQACATGQCGGVAAGCPSCSAAAQSGMLQR